MGKESKGFGHHPLGIQQLETLLQQGSQFQQQEKQGRRKDVVDEG